MTDRAVAYKPGKKGWIKSSFGSGLCFTVSYDELQRLLKTAARLRVDEKIERVEISSAGITVFIEPEE